MGSPCSPRPVCLPTTRQASAGFPRIPGEFPVSFPDFPCIVALGSSCKSTLTVCLSVVGAIAGMRGWFEQPDRPSLLAPSPRVGARKSRARCSSLNLRTLNSASLCLFPLPISSSMLPPPLRSVWLFILGACPSSRPGKGAGSERNVKGNGGAIGVTSRAQAPGQSPFFQGSSPHVGYSSLIPTRPSAAPGCPPTCPWGTPYMSPICKRPAPPASCPDLPAGALAWPPLRHHPN